MPEELRGFYMYLRQAFGPMAQGPVALVSRQGDECVFSVDALGLRPLWQLETAEATCSRASRAWWRLGNWSPSRSRWRPARR